MSDIKPFKGQDYEELKSQHDENNLFEDPLFRPVDKSMYASQKPPQGVRWKRPKEVRRNAQFVVDGYDRVDMDQGYIGNCWFIAGAVGIMQSPSCFAKVVPPDQGFDSDYAGIFHFRFWQYGEWVDVVIDDRLPFWPDGKLVFANNKEQPDEFWAPLLEKAYAKLYGNYENLEAGQTTDALIDMSGGIEESFDLKAITTEAERSSLWTALFQGTIMKSIMGCSITPDPSVKEARQANGLVKGHAYTVTSVHFVNGNQLIRIRNPWGNDAEWNGAWSDKSSEWNSVSRSDKEEIGFSKLADGEFWMSYKDFLKHWDSVQICHLSAGSFSGAIAEANDLDAFSWKKLDYVSQAWECQMYHSEWKAGRTAGGCGTGNPAKFWTNPQFLINVEQVDEKSDEDLATIIVAMMQKDSRLKRKGADSSEEFIQFRLYRLKDGVYADGSGMRFYSNQLDRCGTSGSYINSREITKRFRVKPGSYVIIPSTYDADINCEFMIRVFTEHVVETSNLDQHKEEELSEEESFFVLEDTDHLFNSWSNLLEHDD